MLVIKQVSVLDRDEYLEYECPVCLSTFFYEDEQYVHIHHCPEALEPRPVFVINKHAFLNVPEYHYLEQRSAVKEK